MKFNVFLINLARSEDRLEHSEKQLNALGIEFERLEAIDGATLTEAQIHQHYDETANLKLYKKNLSAGEIACYLSHRKAWKRIIDDNLDYAVILEDDSAADSNFIALHSALSKLRNWDYIRIANFPQKYTINERIDVDSAHELVHFNQIPINTAAQVVSMKGAKQLYSQTTHFCRPVDIDLKHYWEKGFDLLGLTPVYMTSSDKFESSISAISHDEGREKASKFIRRLKYIVNFKIHNYLNNRKRPKLSDYLK
ncbi:MAG: glycosyl transferase family 25 [Alphaproteobacteria bacterium]|jgi:glycosyl transferase family 25